VPGADCGGGWPPERFGGRELIIKDTPRIPAGDGEPAAFKIVRRFWLL
jgi:hypothetical protein